MKVKAVGSRSEVMHGTANHTSGGLRKDNLKYNKHGRIVSRKASARGAKSIKKLFALGFKPTKKKFRLFKKSDAKKVTKKKLRGGNFMQESGSSGSQ